MKSARSLALIACLVTSALKVTAQERPLARALLREATRLAANAQTQPADAGWSRVRERAPGTEIIVTAKGLPPGKRYILLADESGLTMLNLAAVGLQLTASRVLLDLASHHPEVLLAPQTGATLEQDNVRVGADGVFVAGRRVADLAQVVERISRTDVVEIGTITTRGSTRGAAGGAGLGFLVGLVTFLGIEFNHCPTVDGGCHGAWGPLAGLALVGSPVAGGLWGYHHGHHKTVVEEVIYRAP